MQADITLTVKLIHPEDTYVETITVECESEKHAMHQCAEMVAQVQMRGGLLEIRPLMLRQITMARIIDIKAVATIRTVTASTDINAAARARKTVEMLAKKTPAN